MVTPEERIAQLEKRLMHLEGIIRGSEMETEGGSLVNPEISKTPEVSEMPTSSEMPSEQWRPNEATERIPAEFVQNRQESQRQSYDQEPQRQSYDQEPQRQSYDQEPQRQSYDQEPQRQSYDQEPQRQSYDQEPQRQSHDQEPQRQSYDQEPQRQNYDQRPQRQNSDQGYQRQNYDQGPLRQPNNQGQQRQAYDQGPYRSPYNQRPYQSLYDQGAYKQPYNPRPQRQADNSGDKHKDKEALIGKYIIGALAALLIFVAAISFVGLVWNQLTSEIKLLIISLAGIILTALGFWHIRTRKNVISSIILGTGAGLLFIDILSANLVFRLIGNNLSILLAGIWAVFFILSSGYTKLFFTTIIAYIGSYITLIIGLALMQSDMELWILIIFASGVSAGMIYTAFKKNRTELLTAIILSFVSYGTMLLYCCISGLLNFGVMPDSYTAQAFIMLIIYVLMNVFYKNVNNKDGVPLYLIISITTVILTDVFIIYLSHEYLFLELIGCYILFFIINLIQFILNGILYKNIEKYLTICYTIILVVSSMLINIELYQSATGIVMIALLLIASEKILKIKRQELLITLIILFDPLLFLFFPSEHPICSVYGTIQLLLIGYVLWRRTELKEYAHINVLKIIGVIVIIINSFKISYNIVNYINAELVSTHINNAIGYFIIVIVMISLLQTGYFKNWKNEQFKFFSRNAVLEEDKDMNVFFYLLSTCLYFYGLGELVYVDSVILQLIFTLTVTALAVAQSKVLLSGNLRNKKFTGIWLVLKYLILTWAVLGAFSNLSIVSAVYSISGLVVAIAGISVGFKLRNKGLRLYGLVLTIIMVVKFIIVDLSQENSITRVLAAVAGGVLCFLISFIYNKLSENYE